MKKRPVGALRALIREYASISRVNEGIFDDFLKFITPTIGPSGYPQPALGQRIAEPITNKLQDVVMTLKGATEAVATVAIFLLVQIPASLISSRVARDEAAFEPKILGSKLSLTYSGDPNFVVVGENPYDGKLLIIEYSGSTADESLYPAILELLTPNDRFSQDFAGSTSGTLRGWNFAPNISDPFKRGYDLALYVNSAEPVMHPNGKRFYLVDYADVGIAPKLKGALAPEFGVSGLFTRDPNKKDPASAESAPLKRPTPLANASVSSFECELEPDEVVDYMLDGLDDPQGTNFLLGVRCTYQYANSPSVGIVSAVLGGIVGGASTKTWQGAGLGAIIGGLATDIVLRFPVLCWSIANKKYAFAAANLFIIGAQVVSAGAYRYTQLSSASKAAAADISMQILAGLLPDYILQRDGKAIADEMSRLSKDPAQARALLTQSERAMLTAISSRYSDI